MSTPLAQITDRLEELTAAGQGFPRFIVDESRFEAYQRWVDGLRNFTLDDRSLNKLDQLVFSVNAKREQYLTQPNTATDGTSEGDSNVTD